MSDTSKPYGGFAFPAGGGYGGGLTVRDYFAAAALTGILAGHAGDDVCFPSVRTAAEDAYAFADAMIEARAKKSGD